jgi:hypothetical protein
MMKRIILICAPEPLTHGFLAPLIKDEIIANGLPPVDWQKINCLQIGDTPVSAAIIKAFEKHCRQEAAKRHGCQHQLRLNYLPADGTLLKPKEFPDRENMIKHLREMAGSIPLGGSCLTVADARAIKILLGLDSRSRKQIKPLAVYEIKIDSRDEINIHSLAAA